MSLHDRRTFLKRTGGALGALGVSAAGGVHAVDHAATEPGTAARTDAQGDLPPSRDSSTDDNWLEFRAGPANTGALPAAPGVDPAAEDCTRIYEGDVDGEPAIVDGTLYVAEKPSGGRVLALDAVDGTVQWTSDDIGAPATPAVGYGCVFVVTYGETYDGGRLLALDAGDGTVEWDLTGPDSNFASPPSIPTVAYETVFVVDRERVHAVDVADGSIRWDREVDETFYASTRPPAVSDGRLYVVTAGPLYAFDPRTGETLWQTDETEEHETFGTDGNPLRATADRLLADEVGVKQGIYDPGNGDRIGEVVGFDATLDADGIVRKSDGTLIAHRFGDGDVWEFSAERLSQHAVAGDRVYVYVGDDGGSAREHHLVALEKHDGEIVWTYEIAAFEDAGYVDVVVTGDAVYALGQEEIHAIHVDGDGHDH